MGEEEKPPKETASFNSAAEYCKSLIIIERDIAECFKKQMFYDANESMEILWMELTEWMDEDETKEHAEIRTNSYDACVRLTNAKKTGKNFVDTKDIELLKYRNIMLKKIIHKYGLRMAKTDDLTGVPALMRPARMGFRR